MSSSSSDNKKKILVVDDEKGIRDSLSLIFKTNFDVKTAEDGEECLELLKSYTPDIILLDVMMPRLNGIDTLRAIRKQFPKLPVIMLTASSTVSDAVESMKLGANDYLNKPFDVSALTDLIINMLSLGKEEKGAEYTSQMKVEADFGPIIGQSKLMQAVFQKVKQVAARDTTVLITGESGTGKELIARQIHENSPRKNAPFIAINCAAIPETLIESELFGHEKGAFTSAVEQRIGHFELADGGTIFLDEIGELNLAVQVKLLRFLQEHEFYRIGRTKPISVDVRIVAATNRKLEELTKEKKFREDLYYRINVINVELPPLRDRFDDIPRLINAFINKYSPSYSNRVLTFDEGAMERMVEYPWPGNVRELENDDESLLALAPNDTIREEDLPPKLKQVHTIQETTPNVFEGSLNFHDAEKVFEAEMIIKALKKTNWVQTRAADLLGISRRILKYKMDKLGISETPETEIN